MSRAKGDGSMEESGIKEDLLESRTTQVDRKYIYMHCLSEGRHQAEHLYSEYENNDLRLYKVI